MRAAKEYKVKTIILGGGVTANKELRRQFSNQQLVISNQVKLLMPEMEFTPTPKNKSLVWGFTGDNAAMIALAAYFRWIKQKKSAVSRTLKANGNLKLA